jgi:CRISPR-associated endonuclease/helicase Cas3
MTYFAHTVDRSLAKGQYLADHLLNVARGAKKRASEAMPDHGEIASAAEVVGLLHDVGKYRDGFISHLKGLVVAEAKRHHKQAGAAWAKELELRLLVIPILGHHGGMPDEFASSDSLNQPAGHEAVSEIRTRAITDCPSLQEIKPGLSEDFDEFGIRDEELLTRLLFSCLVDADWEDTGEHERTAKGIPPDPIPKALDADGWLTTVLDHIAKKANAANPGVVASARSKVLEKALEAAQLPPGLFSLTVPTGGGKTLSGVAFALAHARVNQLRRIIYVVPYLSILEQNAKAIREALGLESNDIALFEHHSLADRGRPTDTPDEAESTSLADSSRRSENWDAPVVITTNVMFFESLFSNQPRRCRKLHNIARSVIFLDECQNIPPKFLAPTCAMLKQLTEVLGCSIVFATATQPDLDHPRLGDDALLKVHEIVPGELDLFTQLKRVRLEWPKPGETMDWAAVAKRMATVRASLCVVNSRLGARELFQELKARKSDGTFHLSTSMCPAHRKEVLDEVRARLLKGSPCRLVSTQLIEAGVDVDFPLVLREMAPLDSIIQAAGRCNREGKIPDAGGLVIVFRSAAAAENPRRYFPPDLWYKAGREIVESFLASGLTPEIDDPLLINEYFQRLYSSGPLDQEQIGAARMDSKFQTVDQSYRLIENAGLPVVVPTWDAHQEETESLIDTFESTRAGFRSLASFQVNLRCDRMRPPSGVIEEKEGLFVWRGLYDSDTGWGGQDDDLRWVV